MWRQETFGQPEWHGQETVLQRYRSVDSEPSTNHDQGRTDPLLALWPAFGRSALTRHHCRPREKGGTQDDVELLCPQCHGMVHATYTNDTLAAGLPDYCPVATGARAGRVPALGGASSRRPGASGTCPDGGNCREGRPSLAIEGW